jgi:hypothetical protein
MKLNVVTVLACIAGMVMYLLLGPQLTHLRGLMESMVLAELFSRIVTMEKRDDR